MYRNLSGCAQVVGRLDMVDSGIVQFFRPAAEKVMSSSDPTGAMAAALAALSGVTEVPKPRSLLSQVLRHFRRALPLFSSRFPSARV